MAVRQGEMVVEQAQSQAALARRAIEEGAATAAVFPAHPPVLAGEALAAEVAAAGHAITVPAYPIRAVAVAVALPFFMGKA